MKRLKSRDAIAVSFRDVPGLIGRDALYRADELKARMGWKDAAFRAACRKGLKVYRVGKRAFVIGSDIIAFVTENGGER